MESQNDGCWKGPLETVESTPAAQSRISYIGQQIHRDKVLGISKNRDSTTYVECLIDCPPSKKRFSYL